MSTRYPFLSTIHEHGGTPRLSGGAGEEPGRRVQKSSSGWIASEGLPLSPTILRPGRVAAVAEKHSEEQDGGGRGKQRVVTYEAADRGAVCCLGCQAWALILAGIGFGAWAFFDAQLWRAVIGAILLIGGIALNRYLATGRNRWEVSFDRDRRLVTILSYEAGSREVREIPFEDIRAVLLRDITRDVTSGASVPHKLPVLQLVSGDNVALDERLSIKDPERADEVAEEMRALLGLSEDNGLRRSDIR